MLLSEDTKVNIEKPKEIDRAEGSVRLGALALQRPEEAKVVPPGYQFDYEKRFAIKVNEQAPTVPRVYTLAETEADKVISRRLQDCLPRRCGRLILCLCSHGQL